MPELSLNPGLVLDTATPGQMIIKLDPALTVSPDEIAGFESTSQKGVAGGYAPLGANRLVPAEFLPEASAGTGSTANLPFYDIRSYGAAVGNADNAAAIQAAINAAETAGGAGYSFPRACGTPGLSL